VPLGATGIDWNGSVSGQGTSKTTTNTAGTYQARVRAYLTVGGTTCYSDYSTFTAGTVYSTFTAGSITTASGSVGEGTNPGITITNATHASGGDGNITYQWRRSGSSNATLTGDAETYDIGNDTSNYETAGTYYFTRYAKDETCNTEWKESTGTYTLTVRAGVDQPQGSCTFTPPEVVGTFQTFNKDYSDGTYVTLTDSRDNKNYTVVKIGVRWVMAQNLNYQDSLTWQTNSADPSTVIGQDLNLIGSFWCPGGYSSTTTISTLASCDVWGALYSWETAMMVDGKWTSSGHTSSSWSEPSYGTSWSSGNALNHGRSDAGGVTDGRGICPENWHVPTDKEWGDILNEMETGTKNHNTLTGWMGRTAGSRAKSTCTAPDGVTSGDTYVSDTQANWYYNASALGTDNYGFRVLPASYRSGDGSCFTSRGVNAYFWSSSAFNSANAWSRSFYYGNATVGRYNYNRSSGFSVRCVRDE
jgi:uncharacterized protein (TIGR02145 family)